VRLDPGWMSEGLARRAQLGGMASALELAGFILTPEQGQVRLDLSCALIAMVAVLLHRLPDNALQFDGDFRIDLLWRDRLGVQNRIQSHERVGSGERLLAGGHFV